MLSVDIFSKSIQTTAQTFGTVNLLVSGEGGAIDPTQVVTISDTQTISGSKTFTAVTNFNNNIVVNQTGIFGDMDISVDEMNISGLNLIVTSGMGVFNNDIDLNNSKVLNASNIVYNTGNQTISGVKSFIGDHNISGNTSISGNLTVTGNLNAPGNYYVKLARLSDQIISQGSDAVIQFSGISDPNNWYNKTTYRTTPTVSGNYYISVATVWRPGTIQPTNQINIQIRKGASTIALAQEPVHSGMNITQNACAIANLNGTTGDYIDVTAYTSNTTSQTIVGTADGAWTKMELFKLN